MEKFLCIHGHFYQPPRENPWLETVELQDSARPFHDWNERITAECYAPNAFARLLDKDFRIDRIVSNYSRISFNFGPTLLSWMKDNAPDLHQAIVDSDKESQQRFSGHGSALAQCYNHMIMPLANRRDQYTQVLWGIRDFEYRFGRKPEGMWLPETAADDVSLEVLAEHGIQFTILSPFQASRVRAIGGRNWHNVNGGMVDPSRPYRVKLPSGRFITVFFYDAHVSKAVAFEKLLTDGHTFAGRLMDIFDDHRDWDQIAHIATDGESYGHHHRYGEMALAYALNYIEANQLARLTNYGEYLEKHPPRWEAQIHQRTAWSCSHGLERWGSHCGCSSGGRPGWNQNWRRPLREALNWLRDELAPRYEGKARQYFQNPWAARDDYISIILDRSPENLQAYCRGHCGRELSEPEQIEMLRLLEMQRHAMLMFTSCGWFFDELSGIETVQVIQYAARAIQVCQTVLGEDLEPAFMDRLAKANSNIREFGDGRRIYQNFVKPAIMDREKITAHFAVSSLFESYPEVARIYTCLIEQEDRQVYTVGNARLAVGRVKGIFEITRAGDVISYAVLHMGGHNLNCGVRHYQGPEAYAAMSQEIKEAFERADFPQVIRLIDKHFGESNYNLKNLFRDEQRKVLAQILASTRDDIQNTYRQLTDRYAPLMRFLADIHAPAPPALQNAVTVVLNSELRQQFESDAIDLERVRDLLRQASQENVALDADTLGYAMKNHLDHLSDEMQRQPEDVEILQRFASTTEFARILPFEINLWKPQNLCYRMCQSILPEMRQRAQQGEKQAHIWVEQFHRLSDQLGFSADFRSP